MPKIEGASEKIDCLHIDRARGQRPRPLACVWSVDKKFSKNGARPRRRQVQGTMYCMKETNKQRCSFSSPYSVATVSNGERHVQDGGGIPALCWIRFQNQLSLRNASIVGRALDGTLRFRRWKWIEVVPFRADVQARSQGIRNGGYILRGVWGSSPRKIFKFKVANTPNLMIFFNCQRNFGCPNTFCSWRKCQTSCKRHSQRRSSIHWTFEIHGYYMWWYCSVEWFGRVWKVWGRWEEYF